MKVARGGAALLLLGLLGCALGGSVERWKPSGQAAGSEIELFLLDGRSLRGELLALDSAGFLVLQPARMVRVDPAAARSGAAFKTGFDLPLSKDTRERLRLMSRYPQGVSVALEQALLQTYGWKRVETETGSASP